MRAGAPAIPAVRSGAGAERVRRVAPAVLAGVIDAAAAALLLAATPQPDGVAIAAAASLHLAAALLLAGRAARHDARRWLGAVAVIAIPCVGAAIAFAALAARGGEPTDLRRDVVPPTRWSAADLAARRGGDRAPLCDALLSGDDELRRAALATLVRRDDPEGLALLRWAARVRDPDLALLAALALDEIGERAEKRSPTRHFTREVRHVAI